MSHRILIPFELPDANPVPPAVVGAVRPMEVVVLGHFGLPEQTPPSVGRDQFEAEAGAELEDLAAAFGESGVDVTTRLVFGKDRAKTIDRIAVEEECDVILTPGDATAIERVLVPLRGDDNFDRILSFVAELLAASGASATLYHTASEADRRPGQEILADAADRLAAEGVDPDRITQRLAEDGDPRDAIVEAGEAFDVLVLGESEPSLRDRVFGELLAGITVDTSEPTFVIRDA
jgi:nucleotide-binding universal stress UspA family protein